MSRHYLRSKAGILPGDFITTAGVLFYNLQSVFMADIAVDKSCF